MTRFRFTERMLKSAPGRGLVALPFVKVPLTLDVRMLFRRNAWVPRQLRGEDCGLPRLALAHPGPVHACRIERQRELSITTYGNDAAAPSGARDSATASPAARATSWFK